MFGIMFEHIIDVMFNIFTIKDSDDERPVYHLPLHPTTMSNQENVIKRAQLGEEAYQAWLNQPPIQFPLRPESPIQNLYSNTSSSHVGDEGNDIEVGMDDFWLIVSHFKSYLLLLICDSFHF
jgi:hypothetical protein